MQPTIQTCHGRYFDFRAPDTLAFDIDEIAHALSNICRFTGHPQRFYSVAQHSVLVSHLVPREHALEGLMHDAHEAFVGDVSAPMKLLLPDYRALEKTVEQALRAHFGLPLQMPPCIKHADLVALQTERLTLMTYDRSDGQWADLRDVEVLPGLITPLPPGSAYAAFMDRWHVLTGVKP